MASSNGNGGVWDKNAPLHYVAQVIRKLDDGTYPTVPTKCFCGAQNDTLITEIDRYTIPHRMVLCENCMLMRVNPRMTEEAYRQFYEIEYRKIYDGFEHKAKSEDDEFLFLNQCNSSLPIQRLVKTVCDLEPKSVIDIGCYLGGTLSAFQESGATVYGVEWTEEARKFATTKGIDTVCNLDDLITRGVKADLVIMKDIIEHFMDLREMEKIQHLLTEKSRIFLYTPGFFADSPRHVFQNAHTFQFIASTLDFVMNQMGYVSDFLDEKIVSIWRYIGPLNFPSPPPTFYRTYIIEHFEQKEMRTLPPVRTHCKFTEKEMLVNLEANLARKLPVFKSLQDTCSGSVIVIGGGPSVDGQLDKIKELRANGAGLVVIERMYPWCTEHGIKPDFVVALDAGDDVSDGFTNIQEGVKHLIVATINPSVLKALEGYETYIWSGSAGAFPDAQPIWHKNGYTHVTIVNTGSTVVLGSVFLSLIL